MSLNGKWEAKDAKLRLKKRELHELPYTEVVKSGTILDLSLVVLRVCVCDDEVQLNGRPIHCKIKKKKLDMDTVHIIILMVGKFW